MTMRDTGRDRERTDGEPVRVQLSMAGICCLAHAAPPEYSRAIAVKMLSVPSVTMNGGSFSRVTSSPFSKPQAVRQAMPISRARSRGRLVRGEIGHHQHREDGRWPRPRGRFRR